MMTMTQAPEGVSGGAPAPAQPSAKPVGLGQVFLAMARKESREAGLVVALAAAAYGLVLGYLLWEHARLAGQRISSNYDHESLAVPASMLTITVVAGPLAALLVACTSSTGTVGPRAHVASPKPVAPSPGSGQASPAPAIAPPALRAP